MTEHSHDNARAEIYSLTKAIAAGGTAMELAQHYIKRASLYEVIGESASSVADLLDALDVAENKTDIVKIKLEIALAMAKKDLKEQAMFWAMGAIDADLGNADGYYVLGLICDSCGFTKLAIELLQKALDIQPQHWDAMRVLGSCLRETFQIEKSIEILSRYVANNPNEPLGLFDLAWSLHVMPDSGSRIQTARNLYQKALNNNPSLELRALIEKKLEDIRSIDTIGES
jgi:tetratricopeptide (TPR) repeat protein